MGLSVKNYFDFAGCMGTVHLTRGTRLEAGCGAGGDSPPEEGQDEVVEGRDGKQGGEKHGKSTKKTPSIDLPGSCFTCFGHLGSRHGTFSQESLSYSYGVDSVASPEVSVLRGHGGPQ